MRHYAAAGSVLITLCLAGCGDDAKSAPADPVAFDAEGLATLDLVPGSSQVEPRGLGGATIGDQLARSVVPLALEDLKLTARGSIEGRTVRYDRVCLTIDLCTFYNVNELGTARASVPASMELEHFSTTFSGELTLEIVATDHGGSLGSVLAPTRFDSLEPIEACPTEYCTDEPLEVRGGRVTIGDAPFVGEIALEMDLLDVGGADVSIALGGGVTVGPVIDAASGVDVFDLTLPL